MIPDMLPKGGNLVAHRHWSKWQNQAKSEKRL
jgi:hypothetical protein